MLSCHSTVIFVKSSHIMITFHASEIQVVHVLLRTHGVLGFNPFSFVDIPISSSLNAVTPITAQRDWCGDRISAFCNPPDHHNPSSCGRSWLSSEPLPTAGQAHRSQTCMQLGVGDNLGQRVVVNKVACHSGRLGADQRQSRTLYNFADRDLVCPKQGSFILRYSTWLCTSESRLSIDVSHTTTTRCANDACRPRILYITLLNVTLYRCPGSDISAVDNYTR